MCAECFWFGRTEVFRERERNKEAQNDPEETGRQEEKQGSSAAERGPAGDAYVPTRR